MKFDKERLRAACAIEGQERPWTARAIDGEFVTVVDANGMFVADFGRGPLDEARLTVEAVELLPAALARIEELESLALRAVEIGINLLNNIGNGISSSEQPREIRAAVEGGGE